MVNKNKLRAEIVKNGYTQADVAKKLDMSEKTFISRVKKSAFKTSEVEVMVDFLGIEDPAPIFFDREVT